MVIYAVCLYIHSTLKTFKYYYLFNYFMYLFQNIYFKHLFQAISALYHWRLIIKYISSMNWACYSSVQSRYEVYPLNPRNNSANYFIWSEKFLFSKRFWNSKHTTTIGIACALSELKHYGRRGYSTDTNTWQTRQGNYRTCSV